MKILLLSAYDAESHKRWREGLVANLPEHQWTSLVLPPRYFSWRIRGNGLTWAFSQRELLSQGWDLILATSMVDLATLKGLVPELAGIRSIVYFHENQFEYPVTPRQHSSLEPQLVNLYSALAADATVFNSEFNKRTFLSGVETLLSRLPDQVPAGVNEKLKQSARVLPVPLDEALFSARQEQHQPDRSLQILWNHRWEYDKGPAKLLACVNALPENLNLSFHIVGQQFRQLPQEFERLRLLLQTRGWLGEFGFVDDAARYQMLLGQCDLVLSTAIHDFQGLSVLEATAAGCIPVVPDRLAYRELFAPEYRYQSCYDRDVQETHGGVNEEATACAVMIQGLAESQLLPSSPDLRQLSWNKLAAKYRQLLASGSISAP